MIDRNVYPCSKCQFWQRVLQNEPGYSHFGTEFGKCRHRSPRQVGWPVTHQTDWCGDFSLGGSGGAIE